jgi:hypothetical protein
MTQRRSLSDETFLALREALDTESLIDLMIAIGEYNGMVRIMEALQIDLESEFLTYLERFPLPARATAVRDSN